MSFFLMKKFKELVSRMHVPYDTEVEALHNTLDKFKVLGRPLRKQDHNSTRHPLSP